jgi:glucose-6-phosphate isomerase
MSDPRKSAWGVVFEHSKRLEPTHMRSLFESDPQRATRYQAEACGIFVDFAKNRIDDGALAALFSLAETAGLAEDIERLFGGEKVNATEGRAALHMALRAGVLARCPEQDTYGQDDVMPQVRGVLARIKAFSDDIRSGARTGHGGRAITDVVNIGIGGSDLGPAMVCDALRDLRDDGPRAHFVSNLDATHLSWTLETLRPETTLFVIASKTFGTQETLTNARSARAWTVSALGEEAVGKHFIALSTNVEKVREFGIDAANMFEFWDWVGGRYSLWSAVGISIALGLGYERFEALHRGAAAMDAHFRTAKWQDNLPVILALLQVWYRNGFGAQTHAILPYDFSLRMLPSYLQQLEMESLGKHVARDGSTLEIDSCPVIWGGPGNNGQHAFYQLMHQGTTIIPSDFIVSAFGQHDDEEHQLGVLANALGQTEGLMRGRTLEESKSALAGRGMESEQDRLAPHLVMAGNQPSTVILYEKLSPEVLGSLVALYEHKVFVQSVLLDINAFDQYGVELGKELANRIQPELAADTGDVTEGGSGAHDSSTRALIERVRRIRSGA